MRRRIDETDLQLIEAALRRHSEPMTSQQIAQALTAPPPRRTLQYRLKFLVDGKRLVMEGEGRWARYRLPSIESPAVAVAGQGKVEARGDAFQLSHAGADIRDHVRQPPQARRPAGYNRAFLDSFRPNRSFYLTEAERAHLRLVGTPAIAAQPAGTYVKQILSRLLIDLAWNSSRLEGNTYSLLDTERLIELGEESEGKDQQEAQMILNHKDTIEFLVESAEEIGFDRYTILNLHALLANNLLPDPAAAGRLRHRPVGINGSVFHPLEVPQLIAECFDQLLETAAAITDPFEQAFFAMVQLPYLQPFEDVNKRVSRLSANIPFIRNNLSPLSFVEVPRDSYTEAVLGVYEMNRTELLRDLFIWAYERSAARYAAARQSLGEPDPFRMRHRAALREAVADVIRRRLDKRQASLHLAAWAEERIALADRGKFRETAESELLNLHEGNFARYQVRRSEFVDWQDVWNR